MSERRNLQTLNYFNAGSAPLLPTGAPSNDLALGPSGPHSPWLQAESGWQGSEVGHPRHDSTSNRRLQPRRECDWGCNCSCHARRSLTSLERLSSIIGNVSVKFRAPRGNSPCDPESCRRKSPPMIQIDYLFPPWMLMAITSTTIIVPSLHSWNITLRVCRVVPDSAIIFRFALDGNLQGMRMLFDAGSASAHDVDASTGISALLVRLRVTVQVLVS